MHKIALCRLTGQPGDVIELVPSGDSVSAAEGPRESCAISASEQGTYHVYYVDLPDYLSVRPAALKRFAYDHEQIRQFVAQWTQVNVELLTFEPWSRELRDRLEATLRVALVDLAEVFDVTSVACDHDGADIRVTIEGEHKNGERRSMQVLVGAAR